MVKTFSVNEGETTKESPKGNERAGGSREGIVFENSRDNGEPYCTCCVHNLCWVGKPGALKGTRKEEAKYLDSRV